VRFALLIGVASLAVACTTRDQGAATVPPAPATPVNAVGAVTASATDANAVNENLVKRGYRTMRRNGQLLYCQTQTLTGTHFNNTVCLTEAQIRARDQDTQNTKDQLGREGRAACPSGGCT
jgi:hypothetical protein